MMAEENVLQPGSTNALTEIFGITPTPLDDGLAKLADSLREQLPSEGTGALQRQRYWADIRNSRMSARELLELVRTQFDALAPEEMLELGAEPGTLRPLELGQTITMEIPMRGTIQVRVTISTASRSPGDAGGSPALGGDPLLEPG